MTRLRSHRRGPLALVALLLVAPGLSAETLYQATKLSHLTNNELVNYNAGNRGFTDSGFYVGRDDGAYGVAQGASLDIMGPLPGYGGSSITALNESGAAVGNSYVGSQTGERDAYFAPYGGAPQALPRLAHGGNASSVNDQNLVAGASYTDAAGTHTRAVVWQHDGSQWQVQDLGGFGRTDSWALAINNHNQVLVRADDSGSNTRYLVYDLDAASSFDLPATSPSGYAFSPSRLTDNGLVLGVNGPLWDTVANEWVSTTRLSNTDVNESGVVVAYSSTTVWQDDVALANDVNTRIIGRPDLTIYRLYRINGNGQILAQGHQSTDGPYDPAGPAWLLTPTGSGPTLQGVSTVDADTLLLEWDVTGVQVDVQWSPAAEPLDWQDLGVSSSTGSVPVGTGATGSSALFRLSVP